MCPVWEAALREELKTHRSEEPLSKSMFMVWPPIVTGARYSVSPCSGVAATTPVPAVALVAAEVVFPAVAVLALPVDIGAFAAFEEVAFAAFCAPLFSANELVDVSNVEPPADAACACPMASISPGGRGIRYFR